jgi:DNA-binding NarL/FixJ family response regulator
LRVDADRQLGAVTISLHGQAVLPADDALDLALRLIGAVTRLRRARPGGAAVTARTPLGPAAPGSRLDRLAEAQRIIRGLVAAGHTNGTIGAAIGRAPSTVGDWRNGHRAPSKEQLAELRALAANHGTGPPARPVGAALGTRE